MYASSPIVQTVTVNAFPRPQPPPMAPIKSLPTPQSAIATVLLAASTWLFFFLFRKPSSSSSSTTTTPISVNYHFTRKCNKTCAFCFHTEKSSDVASQADMARALTLLKQAGMRKINFAGGEPFLYPDLLG